eukprot:gene37388-46127_t
MDVDLEDGRALRYQRLEAKRRATPLQSESVTQDSSLENANSPEPEPEVQSSIAPKNNRKGKKSAKNFDNNTSSEGQDAASIQGSDQPVTDEMPDDQSSSSVAVEVAAISGNAGQHQSNKTPEEVKDAQVIHPDAVETGGHVDREQIEMMSEEGVTEQGEDSVTKDSETSKQIARGGNKAKKGRKYQNVHKEQIEVDAENGLEVEDTLKQATKASTGGEAPAETGQDVEDAVLQATKAGDAKGVDIIQVVKNVEDLTMGMRTTDTMGTVVSQIASEVEFEQSVKKIEQIPRMTKEWDVGLEDKVLTAVQEMLVSEVKSTDAEMILETILQIAVEDPEDQDEERKKRLQGELAETLKSKQKAKEVVAQVMGMLSMTNEWAKQLNAEEVMQIKNSAKKTKKARKERETQEYLEEDQYYGDLNMGIDENEPVPILEDMSATESTSSEQGEYVMKYGNSGKGGYTREALYAVDTPPPTPEEGTELYKEEQEKLEAMNKTLTDVFRAGDLGQDSLETEDEFIEFKEPVVEDVLMNVVTEGEHTPEPVPEPVETAEEIAARLKKEEERKVRRGKDRKHKQNQRARNSSRNTSRGSSPSYSPKRSPSSSDGEEQDSGENTETEDGEKSSAPEQKSDAKEQQKEEQNEMMEVEETQNTLGDGGDRDSGSESDSKESEKGSDEDIMGSDSSETETEEEEEQEMDVQNEETEQNEESEQKMERRQTRTVKKLTAAGAALQAENAERARKAPTKARVYVKKPKVKTEEELEKEALVKDDTETQ